MDVKQFQNIVKRKPHMDILRIIRPNDIVKAHIEAHPQFTDAEKMAAREQLNMAIVLATAAHDGIVRKSGEPYIMHPYAVAYLLAKMRMSLECVIAGLLHDTVEDTTTTLTEIEQLFGDKVSNLVDGVTKLSGLTIGKEEKQAHAFQKLITYAARNGIWVIFIKLADRLHNMMTIESMSQEQQERIAGETLRLYTPLAHRLGVYWMKEELESLSFYYLYRDRWEQVDGYIVERFHNDPAAVLETLQEKVREAIEKNCPSVAGKIDRIYGRIKSYPSIYNKTIKQNKAIGSLHDIIGVRVILDSPSRDDCYLVMAAIHSFGEFTVMNDRFKDYIARPKPNDYQSIHTVVRYHEYSLEVQIRTKDMHRIAEEGNASHWAYKHEISNKDKAMQWLQQVLGELPDMSNPLDFVHDIESAIPLEKISVFTPKGELKTLPEGATVLDFAYAIHGNLGDTCVGGTVNGRKVPIYYRLGNKDEVAIETSKKQFPRHDWLTFVVTHKAKTYIRRHLTQQEREQLVEAGRDTVKQLFEKAGRAQDFNRLETLDGFSEIADKYSLPKEQRLQVLFYKLATGEFKLRVVLKNLFSDEEVEKLIMELPRKVGMLFPERRVKRDTIEVVPGSKSVYIRGVGEVKDYGAAKCCGPEEGDPIVAYISPTRGYIIHKSGCPTLQRINIERVEKGVYWFNFALYKVELIIEIKNTPGALLDVLQEVSNAGLNIESLHLDPRDATEKTGHVYLSFKGTDIRQIERVSQEMKNKKSILSYDISSVSRI